MPVPLVCTCGKRFSVADQHTGKTTICPICGELLSIPAGITDQPSERGAFVSGPVSHGETPPIDRNPALISAANRLQGPAISLILVGGFNILLALPSMAVGILFALMSTEEFARENPQLTEDPHWIKTFDATLFSGIALVILTAAVLMIVGGKRSRALKSYWLAITASCLAAVPCVSPLACLGLGIAVGVWALVVLLRRDVSGCFSS
jgi:hypothetical protein